MVDFAQTVNAPGGVSYAPPKVDSSWISNLYDNFVNSQFDQQKKQINQQSITQGDQQTQLNAQRIAQGQQQMQLQRAFPNGLPRTQDGDIDRGAVASTLARFGDISGAMSTMQQAPPALSPMFSGGGQPQGGGAPASIPAKPLPPPAANSPQGDSGQGTITSLVTDRLPSQNQTTGETIGKIAQVMGVDPNANLTPGQITRAQGLLRKYAPETAGISAGGPSPGGGGNLPPSAAAVSPAPTPSAPQQGAPNGAGAPAAPAAQPAAQPQGGGPITPQVPLPRDPRTGQPFTDPQAAILALRAEAARVGQNPRGAAQARELENWAARIEESIKPVKMGQYDTYVDPRNPSRIVAQGPGAAAISSASTGAAAGATLDADAELYRQTGKLPPNMGRGIQGNVEARRIRERAAEQEIAEGGDPAEWPTRWQSQAATATGRRMLSQRSAGLTLAENEASSLLPRVREASAKVSRTEYPKINSLIEAAQQNKGGTDVIKLGIAVASLIPVYARVLKPTGQITEGDTNRAHEILDKAWSDGQINAALDQMEVELKSARQSLDKTMTDFGMGKKQQEGDGKGAAPAKAAGKPAADGATVYTLPNGKKARVQEVVE